MTYRLIQELSSTGKEVVTRKVGFLQFSVIRLGQLGFSTSSFDFTVLICSIAGTVVEKELKMLSRSKDNGLASAEVNSLNATNCEFGNKLLFPKSVILCERDINFVVLE